MTRRTVEGADRFLLDDRFALVSGGGRLTSLDATITTATNALRRTVQPNG